jgi:hypothetical protein
LHLAFAEFSARCLREHSKRGTLFLHFIGTTLFLACVALLCILCGAGAKNSSA